MTATSKFRLSKDDKLRVSKLTQNLRGSWKKCVEAILESGQYLQDLKELLPRRSFVSHIKTEVGLSEKHAMRIIVVYQKFGKHKNPDLKNASPTVLYKLAYHCTDAQILAINRGKKVKTANGYKLVSQIRGRDFPTPKVKRQVNLDRDLATFLEGIQDEVLVFKRRFSDGCQVNERLQLRETLKETTQCLKEITLFL